MSSGSLAEGFDLPGSDIDIMYIDRNVEVIRNVKDIKYPIQSATYVMETYITHPGFTILKCIKHNNGELLVEPCPCHPWSCPVPIGPKTVSDGHFLWRISFSVAEKVLVHSFNFTQLLCYGLLKLTLKHIININDEVKELLCSYFLKTALFWVSEEEMINCTASTDISSYYKRLAMTKSLIKSESSTFLIDLCKYYYFKTSQYLAQLLPPPNTIGNNYNIRKCYNIHLQDCIKTDAVSGWLLYASFYYVTGKFSVTLILTDYVLSRCSPDMVFGCSEPLCKLRNIYRQNVNSTMTLNEKMKVAIISRVMYCKHSSLIPEELQLEVERSFIFYPPVVMSHCLRFLCYHHLGDIFNRQQALRDLFLTVKEQYLIPFDSLSDSLTILGVCYEILGDKDTAHQCYDGALHCDGYKSLTAEKRKSKLDGNLREICSL
ncbi:uncharacterized protein LOC127723875 [Mytilus californianus]|uniref:uncharacterized protein LOC127723875 n=1 Tax=Mytilus californianus TaxID=6549 RepID=UPI00224555E1|nr:uncharacterized protein LOC127723875 [Mytilus californianus]